MNHTPDHISSEQLVALFQNGNRDALKWLIQRFHPKMKRVIHYYTKAGEPVEDLAQECWYLIIEKLEQVELKISFEAWALTIAKRKSIDWVRAQQRLRKRNLKLTAEYEEESDSQDGISDDSQIKLEQVRAGIEQLASAQKIILTLFYQENLSLMEIARLLDISKGTVKSRLFYAREELKKQILT